MPVIQLPQEAQNYKRQWVALSSDFSRVVGHGPTPEEALKSAGEAGEQDAVLLYIPEEWPQTLIV